MDSILKKKKCVSVIEPVECDYIDISKTLQSNYFCVFSKMPGLIYEMQSFTLPSTSGKKITISRPITGDYFVAGHSADTDELSVTYLMSEDYKNYFYTLKWIRDNMYLDTFNKTLSTMSLFITNNAKIPIIRVDFKDIFPTYVAAISYNIQNSGIITWDATYALYSFKVTYLDGSLSIDIEN